MKIRVSKEPFKLNKEKLFKIGWFLVLFYYLFFVSSELGLVINNKALKYSFFAVVEFVWMYKIFKDKYKPRTFLVILLCSFLAVIPSVILSKEDILLMITFIIAYKGMDNHDFVRFDIKIRLSIFIILFILSVTGIINNYSSVINGSLKYAFGWQHPNTCASTAIIILLEWIYLKWDEIRLKHWLIITICVIFLRIFIAARTSLFAFIFICAWYLCVKKFNYENKPCRSYKSIIYALVYPLLAGLSYYMVNLFKNGSQIGIALNEMLTQRLFFSLKYLTEYGVSLFGQTIEMVSSRQTQLLGNGTQYSGLDMSYINLPVQYGAVFTVLFLAICSFLCYKLYVYRRYPELMLVLFFALVGVMSNVMFTFYRNFTFVFIWSVVSQQSVRRKQEGVKDDCC